MLKKKSSTLLYIILDISEITSDLSSCSPSFSFGDSLSSVDQKKMDDDPEQTYFSNGYLQDPLQDFIDDVLQNQSLTPNYDTGTFFFFRSLGNIHCIPREI